MMKKSASKEKVNVKDESYGQLIERMNHLENSHQIAQSEIMSELNKIYDFEKSVIVQIANSISKMSEKINALTKELEDKNFELNLYREGFNFRLSKPTFLELVKLYQFAVQDQNSNYMGIIMDIFENTEIKVIEAYEGMKFDPKKHIIKSVHKALNENENDTISKVNFDGFYVADSQQNMKVLKYAEVVIKKWEDK